MKPEREGEEPCRQGITVPVHYEPKPSELRIDSAKNFPIYTLKISLIAIGITFGKFDARTEYSP